MKDAEGDCLLCRGAALWATVSPRLPVIPAPRQRRVPQAHPGIRYALTAGQQAPPVDNGHLRKPRFSGAARARGTPWPSGPCRSQTARANSAGSRRGSEPPARVPAASCPVTRAAGLLASDLEVRFSPGRLNSGSKPRPGRPPAGAFLCQSTATTDGLAPGGLCRRCRLGGSLFRGSVCAGVSRGALFVLAPLLVSFPLQALISLDALAPRILELLQRIRHALCPDRSKTAGQEHQRRRVRWLPALAPSPCRERHERTRERVKDGEVVGNASPRTALESPGG